MSRVPVIASANLLGPVSKWIHHIALTPSSVPQDLDSFAPGTRGFPPSHPWQYPAPRHLGLLDVAEPARNRIIESNDVVFLFHLPHVLHHLSAPLPEICIIIVLVVSVWIVLLMWPLTTEAKSKLEDLALNPQAQHSQTSLNSSKTGQEDPCASSLMQKHQSRSTWVLNRPMSLLSTGSLAGSVPFPWWKCERLVGGSSTSLVQV